MTARERLAIEHPDKINPDFEGGCSGCPESYGYLPNHGDCFMYSGAITGLCDKCWDREIPEEPMTARERLAIDHPDKIKPKLDGGCFGCPSTYGYLPEPSYCHDYSGMKYGYCTKCWDREIPEKTNEKENTNTMVMKPIIDASDVVEPDKVDYKREYQILAGICNGYEQTIKTQREQVEKLNREVLELVEASNKIRNMAEEQSRTLEKYEMIVRCCEAFVGRPLIDRN